MNTLSSVIISLFSLSQLALADSEEMGQPEQELLAKYLLQQLTSNTPDPILARLVGEEEAGEILKGEQSQTIATIVPAPPGLSTAGSKQHQTCELVSLLLLNTSLHSAWRRSQSWPLFPPHCIHIDCVGWCWLGYPRVIPGKNIFPPGPWACHTPTLSSAWLSS